MSEFLFRFREALSAANALLLTVTALLLLRAVEQPAKHLPPLSAPLELTLLAPEVPPPPATTPPAAPSPRVNPALPRQLAAIPATPGVAAESDTAAAPPAAPAASPAPAAASITPAVAQPAAVAPANSAHQAEAGYVGKLRAYLHSIKRYPSGREASQQRPGGTATVWFLLRRNGELVEAGIEASAASMLLDNAALSTVRRGAYPAFPDDAWPGKTQQRFTVELDFVPK